MARAPASAAAPRRTVGRDRGTWHALPPGSGGSANALSRGTASLDFWCFCMTKVPARQGPPDAASSPARRLRDARESTLFTFDDALGRNLHTRLADQIGIGILRGDIGPGDPLPSELRICDMMGVSRTAVREAIRVLVGKGLLESKPKSGTRVRDPENWNHLDPDVLRWRLEVTDLDAYLKKLFQLRFAV